MRFFSGFGFAVLCFFGLAGVGAAPAQADLPPLRPQGTQFVDPTGQPVRLWGVNLCALYPTPEQADRIAADLAERQVNLARPHHMLRPSGDWVSDPEIRMLADYPHSTRRLNDKALDRFDYLHAAMRRQGIYSMFAIGWSRTYVPEDVSILETTPEDAQAWSAAMDELNRRHWRAAIDARKMLPKLDDRVLALEEEFARQLLDHRNPYTGLRYAEDAAVISVEMLNEASIEYALICKNDLPAYWQERLIARWEAYARSSGLEEPGDLYAPASPKHGEVRALFFDQLERDYMQRMTEVVRSTGYGGAVTLSNLWRGDMALRRHADLATFSEDHVYADPRVTTRHEDFVYDKSRSVLADQPFVLGEFNQAEGSANIAEQAPYRTMLMLASAAYAAHQDWSGIVWFAWAHGDKNIDAQGRPIVSGRTSSLGNMMRDQMMQDHLRTAGMIFRQGLVAPSTDPITVYLEEPLWQASYDGLMRTQRQVRGGWQNIHAVRRAFGPRPEGDAQQPWYRRKPASPLISDTGQITKDLRAKTLQVVAPQAEAFSGQLTEADPVNLPHLKIAPVTGFGTVILVAADGKPLDRSRHLILSRTLIGDDQAEVTDWTLSLAGLQSPAAGEAWQGGVTRPHAAEAQGIMPNASGVLALPNAGWFELELRLTERR